MNLASSLLKTATLSDTESSVAGGLIGLTAGAGIGTAVDKKNRLRGAILGGLGGGALGAGIGYGGSSLIDAIHDNERQSAEASMALYKAMAQLEKNKAPRVIVDPLSGRVF